VYTVEYKSVIHEFGDIELTFEATAAAEQRGKVLLYRNGILVAEWDGRTWRSK
jgi:hypothetical protein